MPSLQPTPPLAPRLPEETGLPFLFLLELVSKLFLMRGQLSVLELSSHLKLAVGVLDPVIGFMRAEKLCEVSRRGAPGTDTVLSFQLTDAGRIRATDFMSRNAYAGPAPVTLHAYQRQTEAQRVSDMSILNTDVCREFEGIVVSPPLLEQMGAAMNSGRAIYIHGPAGSGKTYLAERLTNLLKGDIWIPHAILVDGEVVQVYDPAVHKAVADEASERLSLDKRASPDSRWIRCRRPTVLTGGELSLEMLELQFDASTRYYQAPPHMKANNGLFIIDDLGRQRCSATDLMNRWIVPLDRRIDFLALHTGHKFMVPFDVIVVFSSNHPPQHLADAAFTRRIGYKIHVGEQTEEEYERIFRKACEECGVPWSHEALRYLLDRKHYAEGRPLLACYPRDILSQVRDRARYQGMTPQLSTESLDWAWHNYFAEG